MEIPISVLKERVKKVEKRSLKEKLDALVVYSSGSSLGFASQTHGYMRYLCDWDARNQAAVLILWPGREKDPILLVPGRSPQLFAKEIMWFDDIRTVPQSEFGKEIVSILNSVLTAGQQVGYIGKSETPVTIYDDLRTSIQSNALIEANHIIDALRIVKDSHAIRFHRRSAKVCDGLFEYFKDKVRSGKPVYQIQADLEHKAKSEGCEYASTFLSVGKTADRPRYAKRECLHIPEKGDQVLLALFVLLDGHWGHAIRTGTMDAPNAVQQKIFKRTLEMQEAALEQFIPENFLDDVWKASESVLARYYPDARDKDWYWLKTGHSIGLDYSDPILSSVFPTPSAMRKMNSEQTTHAQSRIQILPGMLFELHPNIFVPGEATAAIGDMVLVTETGHERITLFPRELMVF